MSKKRERAKINLAPQVPARSGDLEMLFSNEQDTEQASGLVLVRLRVDAVQPDPDQPRRTFPPESLQELADSIAQDGVIQPIEVTQVSKQQYRIVHGERRWRAARMAGLETIPAVVQRRDYDIVTRFVRQLVENIQREDLNDVDRAAGLLHLRDLMQEEIAAEALHKGDKQPWGSKITWAKVGKRLGYSRQRIHQLIQLLKLPEEIQEAIRQGELSERETRVYHGLTATQQRQLHEARMNGDVSSEEMRRVARHIKEMPRMPITEALNEIRLVRPAPTPQPRTTLARRSATQNLSRIIWAQNHLSKVVIADGLDDEERQQLSSALGALAADVAALLQVVDGPND